MRMISPSPFMPCLCLASQEHPVGCCVKQNDELDGSLVYPREAHYL